MAEEFLTRLGEGSKCFIAGDPSQIDLRPNSKPGLLEAMALLNGIEGVEFLRLEKENVVRHPVPLVFLTPYEQGRDESDDVGLEPS
tara:strand:+ start:13151 stop:13408 length:258 start_codon:yes stop_codon:yes gene_type:complete